MKVKVLIGLVVIGVMLFGGFTIDKKVLTLNNWLFVKAEYLDSNKVYFPEWNCRLTFKEDSILNYNLSVNNCEIGYRILSDSLRINTGVGCTKICCDSKESIRGSKVFYNTFNVIFWKDTMVLNNLKVKLYFIKQ